MWVKHLSISDFSNILWISEHYSFTIVKVNEYKSKIREAIYVYFILCPVRM